MEELQHIPTPKTPTHESSRDQRLQLQTLYYTAGWSVTDLLLTFPKLTRRQIDYALDNRPTPQKPGHCGRPFLLTPHHRKELVAWATTDTYTRGVPWKEIPHCLGWGCGEKAIRRAFQLEGYGRRIRRRKPPLSEKNQRERLAWAEEHVLWTDEQWDCICWSDESWCPPGPYSRRQWCTRLIGSSELFHPDCVRHKWQRKIGWMFWGCISGKYGKGEGLFWEKEWKTITKLTYQEHTLPVVWKYFFNHPGLRFQQDGGPGHTAAVQYLADRGIKLIFWPAFSPDLSPIETIWKRMKDILSQLDPEVHRSYPRLRRAVQEAWDTITDAEIKDVIHTMHQRCQDVIDAHGMYTKW
jgi:Transposase